MKKSDPTFRRLLAGSLTAAMLLTQAAAAGFTDTDGHWAKSYIEDLAAKGKINGYEDGSFHPDAQVTNLETLVFVSRICSDSSTPTEQIGAKWRSTIQSAINGLSDWSYSNLAICLEAGVLTEEELEELCSGGLMNKAASREDLAVYLTRAMQLAPAAATLQSYPLTFADTNAISQQARPSVYLLTQNKIVEGMENNRFEPQGQVTRAQVAAMLSRAIEFMEENEIQPEFAAYTTYDYEAGTVQSCAVEGNTVLLTLADAKGQTRAIEIPTSVTFYKDGCKVQPSAITGGYARVNYVGSTKTVDCVKVLSNPKTVSGDVTSVSQDQITLRTSAGATAVLQLDRFSRVLAGGQLGDQQVIDPEADYRTAECVTDGTGCVLSAKLLGGGYEESGILTQVDTKNKTVLVNSIDGVLGRYTIPDGAAVQIDGADGSLAASHVGDYVTLRIGYDDGAVTDVQVDSDTDYIQAVLDSVTNSQGSTNIKVKKLENNSSVTYKLASGCDVFYEGEERATSSLPKGCMVTLRMKGSQVDRIEAASGDYQAEGTLVALDFGETILMELETDKGETVLFQLNPSRLPTIRRDGEASSVDKLTRSDQVSVTVEGGKIQRIDAETDSTTVTGKVDRIALDGAGNRLYLTGDDGETAYTLATNVVITSGSSTINLADVVGGNVTLTIVNGLVTKIELNGGSAATGELAGTVLFVNEDDRIVLLETTGGQADNRVSVSIPSSVKILTVAGKNMDLEDIELGNQLQVFGSYKGETFEATMVLVK